MKIHLATHHGMCFGVREALRATSQAAKQEPATVLGQLVHNPVVADHLRSLGVHQGELTDIPSAPTQAVIITAHGASNQQREAWRGAGFKVKDTTCPLVRKAHDALAHLVESGYFPVIIGQENHTEVRGLRGDFPETVVILEEADLTKLPHQPKYGVISQTTQPLANVLELVNVMKRQHPRSEVRFMDTVCHPTKQRQDALEDLCRRCDVVVVVGGRNSNNTRQLSNTARGLGAEVYQVERMEDLEPAWFTRAKEVGVTAGTSTLDETVQSVVTRLQRFAVGEVD